MEGSHRHHLHQYQQQQQQQHQLLQPRHGRPTAQSRLVALKDTVGEIVEVEGGHIVRSTGRKDRHSKVFTAKGPRDRRVRLSAHTAIQFYDVQDRLGYDRPSKAVDWLIKNAKAAIDELAELPPWNPTDQSPPPLQQEEATHEPPGGPTRKRLPESDPVASSPAFVFGAGNFLPPSLDSDSIADTIKYFFPVSAATGGASIPGGGFQSYPSVDILQRGGSQAQDLRLSLQSFQEPILLHHPQQPPATAEQSPFTSSSSTALAFDGSSPGWPDLNQRAFSWNGPAENGGGGSGGGGGGGGFIFSVPPPQAVPLHPVLGQGQFLTQRGPLQSIASPHVRAWTDAAAVLQPAPSFAAAAGGFSGFRVPARIQGEEEHDGIPRKPSSTSSASRH